jgi:phosphatidylglycerol:prolipoprotein diacylglycerol transferase
MIRELFHIGPLSISPFGVLLVASFLVGYAQLVANLRRLGAGNEDDASALLFAAGIGGIVGGKVYYALLYGDWRLLLDRSGLVWYGGFVVGALAVLWTFWRRRLPRWQTADAMAPALALAYAVGRVGCFLVGDDYGRPTDLPWGVRFPQGLPPTTAGWLRSTFDLQIPPEVPDSALLAVHPTQLYETAAGLLIWWFGMRLLRASTPAGAAADRPPLAPGTTTVAVLALLAVERFLVEFVRVKDDRFLGPFTLAQAISIATLLVLAWLWAWRSPARAAAGSAAAASPRRP